MGLSIKSNTNLILILYFTNFDWSAYIRLWRHSGSADLSQGVFISSSVHLLGYGKGKGKIIFEVSLENW